VCEQQQKRYENEVPAYSRLALSLQIKIDQEGMHWLTEGHKYLLQI
jgi:hypothetical protein